MKGSKSAGKSKSVKTIAEPRARVEERIVIKKKVMEYLDNYQYKETKEFRKADKGSIVIHQRLGGPVGGTYEETSIQKITSTTTGTGKNAKTKTTTTTTKTEEATGTANLRNKSRGGNNDAKGGETETSATATKTMTQTTKVGRRGGAGGATSTTTESTTKTTTTRTTRRAK